MIKYAFAVDDEVDALTDHHGIWTRAIVERHEPYLGRPGYRVSYPDAKKQWECHSGWKPEQCLRSRVSS